MANQKTYKIKPSWKQFFWSYVLSFLTIPIAGLGLISLYFVRKKHNGIRYHITDNRITSIDQKYEHNVDLVDIEHIEIRQSWFQEKLNIAALILHTSASKMELIGLDKPVQLKNILEKAIKTEQKRNEQQKKTHRKESLPKPGSMERINYLTGLWQQGLISDEEYRAEKKHFE